MLRHKMQRLLILFFLVILQGCQRNDDGFAPDTGVPTTNLSKTLTKYGQTVQSSNGWTVDEDHNQFIQKKVLTNGWSVEYQYE